MSCQLDGKQIATIAVTTVAAGAAAYGIYHLVKKRSATSVDVPVIIGCSANIEKKHVVFLQEKAQEYCGNNRDAALQVVLDYAMNQGDETMIFETVRCNTCGGKKDKITHDASIDARQSAYLKEMAIKHNLKDGKNKALRVIIEFAMTDGDVADIFTKERCDKWGVSSS